MRSCNPLEEERRSMRAINSSGYGEPSVAGRFAGSCEHLPKTSSRCESPTDDRAAPKIAGHSLSRMENSRRNIMGTQASESAKKKSFHFDRGETGCCPKFKLRLQVRHAIRRAITLSLLSDFSTKLNRRLVYWP